MHRIITKLLTIPAAGVEPALYPFVSIAWSEESKMAVSDRGSASRQRSADEDEKEEVAYRGNKKTSSGVGWEAWSSGKGRGGEGWRKNKAILSGTRVT